MRQSAELIIIYIHHIDNLYLIFRRLIDYGAEVSRMTETSNVLFILELFQEKWFKKQINSVSFESQFFNVCKNCLFVYRLSCLKRQFGLENKQKNYKSARRDFVAQEWCMRKVI